MHRLFQPALHPHFGHHLLCSPRAFNRRFQYWNHDRRFSIGCPRPNAGHQLARWPNATKADQVNGGKNVANALQKAQNFGRRSEEFAANEHGLQRAGRVGMSQAAYDQSARQVSSGNSADKDVFSYQHVLCDVLVSVRHFALRSLLHRLQKLRLLLLSFDLARLAKFGHQSHHLLLKQ